MKLLFCVVLVGYCGLLLVAGEKECGNAQNAYCKRLSNDGHIPDYCQHQHILKNCKKECGKCPDCKRTDHGRIYRGPKSVTKSGKYCQPWSAHVKTDPNSPEGRHARLDGLVNNYCRNPDNKPNGPWCYISKTTKSWEYCSIPKCTGKEKEQVYPGQAYLGHCMPSDKEMKQAHNTCLGNWRGLLKAGGTVDKLATQCPTFCDHVKEACVWNIACKRCHALVKLCKRSKPLCQKYIATNKKKPEFLRCPQFETCYPGPGIMDAIREHCELIYNLWNDETKGHLQHLGDGGKLSNHCKIFCKHVLEDCAWRIVCKKCVLLMKLTTTRSGGVFADQFHVIMKKKDFHRCPHYHGKQFPHWWITGNWF